MPNTTSKARLILSNLLKGFITFAGAFIAAFALEAFFIPNGLVDGGTVGLSMIIGKALKNNSLIPYFLAALNFPFILAAYRNLGKHFVIHMLVSVVFFCLSMIFLQGAWEDHPKFFAKSESGGMLGGMLQVVVIGGALLGLGAGMIIRVGGSIDGTEILGIILSKKKGYSVGQVVLVCNVFVFGMLGVIEGEWDPPMLSLIAYIVVIKVMDTVIVGFDEVKSVWIISSKSKAISEAIVHELGLGLTIMYGRGGFSGDEREVLYVIAERLQLAELKELIYREDPMAFIAIENLHEVTNGRTLEQGHGQTKMIDRLVSRVFDGKKPKK